MEGRRDGGPALAVCVAVTAISWVCLSHSFPSGKPSMSQTPHMCSGPFWNPPPAQGVPGATVPSVPAGQAVWCPQAPLGSRAARWGSGTPWAWLAFRGACYSRQHVPRPCGRRAGRWAGRSRGNVQPRDSVRSVRQESRFQRDPQPGHQGCAEADRTQTDMSLESLCPWDGHAWAFHRPWARPRGASSRPGPREDAHGPLPTPPPRATSR